MWCVIICSLNLNSAATTSGGIKLSVQTNTRYCIFQVGDTIPSASLYEGTPANKVDIAELCAGKKVVLFAVPGAFTPGCSKVIHIYDIVSKKLVKRNLI